MTTDRHSLARRLVRLYPRRWRERYEAEMLALIEDTGLDRRRAVNVAFGAGREWANVAFAWPKARVGWPDVAASLFFIGAVACLITSAGTRIALLLCKIPTPPVTWTEGGYTMFLPPVIPSRLGLLGPLVPFLAPIRFYLAGMLRPNRGSKVGPLEFGVWILALLAGTTFWQWFRMVDMLGTGVPPTPAWEIWVTSAMPVYFSIQMLFMSTSFISNKAERHRATFEAAKRVAASRPLGLS